MDRCKCGERAIVKVQVDGKTEPQCFPCAKATLDAGKEDWKSKTFVPNSEFYKNNSITGVIDE